MTSGSNRIKIMDKQTKYITALLSIFSTYLEELKLPIKLETAVFNSFTKLLKQYPNLNIHKVSNDQEIISIINHFLNQFAINEVNVFLHQYLHYLKLQTKTNSTIRNYRSDILQLVTTSKQTTLNNLFTQKNIKTFIKLQFNKGLKNSSIKRKLVSISQFANWCEEQGLVNNTAFWISNPEVLFNQPKTITNVKPKVKNNSYLSQDILEDFLKFLKQQGSSHSTIKNYRSDLNQLLFFSDKELNSSLSQVINEANINKFISYQRSKGLKNSSIKRKLVSISQFANWSKENHYLTTDLLWLKQLELAKPVKRDAIRVVGRQAVKQPSAISYPVVNKVKNEDSQSFKTSIESNLKDFAQSIKTKRQKLLLPYLNFALLLLFFIGISYFGYQQFIKQAPTPFAYPSSPTRPTRQLSFQGRLTDTAQNPVTTSTNMAFRLYDNSTGGTLLWDSSTCSVTPDQDGIFNVGLGSDCGSEITEDVFTENSNVWLEVDVASETLTPRQSIKTVAYALNSETLQGYPISSTESATKNTILFMNNGGEIVLGEVSPTIKSTTGTFSIEAQALTLQTNDNGDIILDPDNLGEVLSTGYFSAPGATLSATYDQGTSLVLRGGPSGTANIQEVQDSTGTVLGAIDKSGNISTPLIYPLSDSTTAFQITKADKSTSVLNVDTTNGTIGIGTISPSAKLHIVGSTDDQQLIVQANSTQTANMLEMWDSSGSVLSSIDGTGVANLAGLTINSAYTFPTTDGTANYVLATDGSGTVSWIAQTGGSGDTGYWRLDNGALSPVNDTLDLLLGSNASSSAKFAVLNIGNGTPTASISGTTTNVATYLTGEGNLATTNMAPFTLGGSSTGNIAILNNTSITPQVDSTTTFNVTNNTGISILNVDTTNGRVGIGTTSPSYELDVNGTSRFTDSLLAESTVSLTGLSTDTDNTVLILNSSNQVTTDEIDSRVWGSSLVDGTGTTNYVARWTDSNTLGIGVLYDDGTKIGIGTTSPTSKLHLTGAVTGKALAIFNETGDQDIFTASASGTTKFRVANDGYVYGERFLDITNSAYFLDPAAGANSLIVAGSVGIGTTSPTVKLDVVGTATASANVTMGGQLQVGRFGSTPTAIGEGSMIFNTTTNTHQCYNGTSWYNCGGVLYSNTNTSVASGSYITVQHDLASTDLLANAWINSQSTWKMLDATYQPAIAWEGKNTQKGIYHNAINSYTIDNETGSETDTLHDGYFFDTFEDQTKTDNSTTVSITTQVGDDGSSNYMTLDQRVQAGRVGLAGGQTLSTSTSDNDGNTYLSSNNVNDIYYYDRSKDSTPEVLVELGIDPNWYNGVTLSVATSSASFSQSSTVPENNPNLSTTYNGSLIKASGRYSSGGQTIYITIKSPTTYDWTDYNGESATGVSIDPGTSQTLGNTGVSVTFTGTNYNVGDVFKVASWFTEATGSTRGSKQQFPERSNVIATDSGVDIIDADTQKLWMRFSIGDGYFSSATNYIDGATMLNGTLYVPYGAGEDGQGLRRIMFSNDRAGRWHITYGEWHEGIAQRNNASLNFITINEDYDLINVHVNDVSTAVIPNQPTQEVTVSGWGYIQGDGTAVIEEVVNLPYKFNNTPEISIVTAGISISTTPNNLESCVSGAAGVDSTIKSIQKNNFEVKMYASGGGTLSSSYYNCYTWTATGTVSPKQFVAVATGASGSDGGTTIINETDGTAVDIEIGSLFTNTRWMSQVALTSSGELYIGLHDDDSNYNTIEFTRNIPAITSDETSNAQYRSGYYLGGFSNTTDIGTFLDEYTTTDPITSLEVTKNTSTLKTDDNTIYVGTKKGTTIIQENNNCGTESQSGLMVCDGYLGSNSSVKYYTKDYISEEMVGDIRGMWPLNGSNTASDLEDVSVKGNNLTATNIDSTDAVSGVRDEAYDFNGTDEYLSCTDADCGGTSGLDIGSNEWTVGSWIKTSSTNRQSIITKGTTSDYSYELEASCPYCSTTGASRFAIYQSGGAPYSSVCSNTDITDGKWHYITATWDPDTTTTKIYIDGILENTSTTTSGTINSDSGAAFNVGHRADDSNYFDGLIDEPFVTATAISASKIKQMYEIGYRALQSHGTGLGGGSADSNQHLGGSSNNVGVVKPDFNNQYMYVGTNDTTNGALSKIQLNSDTNIKTYTSSSNTPTGGSTLVDEDITSLSVGYNLEAVGSDASGIKTMGFDNYSTATTGNFVSKTFTLPKNIGSTVLWVSPILDSNDASNTLTVKASNDNGSTYDTCTLVGTDNNKDIPEKEYACTFTSGGNQLKVKFEFARGSNKTNTYVTQYGITWLGETGFRIEQADNNNVRLYNYSGETQQLKLNVTGASVATLATPWTDAGSYLYPTGYESLRIYDGAGSNYLSFSHDGTYGVLGINGTDYLNLDSSGNLLPETDNTQDLGATSSARWKDLYLGPSSLHIQANTTDSGYSGLGLNLDYSLGIDTNGTLNTSVNGTDVMSITQGGNVGIGTSSAQTTLHLDTSSIADNRGIRITVQDDYNAFLQLGHETSTSYGRLVYETANDAMAFYTNNSEKLRIDSSGNVGIGTTNPSEKLHVLDEVLFGASGSTSHVDIGVRQNNTGLIGGGHLVLVASGTEQLRFTGSSSYFSNGNVGIGTNSPEDLLDLNTTSTTSGIEFDNRDALTGYDGDTWLRLNQSSQFTSGVYTPGNFRVDGKIYVDNDTNYLSYPTGDYGSIQINGEGKGNWEGFSINGRYNFMSDDTGTYGMYNDVDNHWVTLFERNSYYRIYEPDSNNVAMTIYSNGHVGIGTTSQVAKLNIGGNINILGGSSLVAYDATGNRFAKLFHSSNGNLHMDSFGGGSIYLNWYGSTGGVNVGNGSAGYGPIQASSFNVSSDRRLKKDIEPIPTQEGLSAIMQLNPVHYKWKNQNAIQTLQAGIIAQEVQNILPSVVSQSDTLNITLEDGSIETIVDPLRINYLGFIPYIIKAVQELNQKLTTSITNINNQLATMTGGDSELISPIAQDTVINIASESGSVLFNNTDNVSVAKLSDSGDLSLLGSLLAQDVSVSGTVTATSARIALLEAGMSELEAMKVNTAEIVNATISGTLYANNIYNLEETLASTLQQPNLLDIITGANSSSESAQYMAELYDIANSASYEVTKIEDLDFSLDDLELDNEDVVLTASALFIENYFKVNGAGYISDSLAVGNSLFVNNSVVVGNEDNRIEVGNGVIAYTNQDINQQILHIQPDGTGSIEMLAGLITLDDLGLVTINGDMEIAGNVKVNNTLLTNLIKPLDFDNPLQVQVAGISTESGEIKESRFEIINEVGTPVATFSAQGKAEFAGGIGIASQDLGSSIDNELEASKTTGKATILAGNKEVKINSDLVQDDTLIYVTALGSTNNQTLYVKSQLPHLTQEATNSAELITTQQGEFVVGFDSVVNSNVSFNWWLVN